MRVSDDGIDFITQHEGVRLEPYRDQAGLPTVGVGHLLTGPSDPFNRPITLDEAKLLLRRDVASVEKAIDRYVTVTLNQNQHDAIASLVFNIGEGAFRISTLLRKLNDGDFAGAAAEFGKWNKITLNGKKVASKGLTRRRRAEADLFLRTAPLTARKEP